MDSHTPKPAGQQEDTLSRANPHITRNKGGHSTGWPLTTEHMSERHCASPKQMYSGAWHTAEEGKASHAACHCITKVQCELRYSAAENASSLKAGSVFQLCIHNLRQSSYVRGLCSLCRWFQLLLYLLASPSILDPSKTNDGRSAFPAA